MTTLQNPDELARMLRQEFQYVIEAPRVLERRNASIKLEGMCSALAATYLGDRHAGTYFMDVVRAVHRAHGVAPQDPEQVRRTLAWADLWESDLARRLQRVLDERGDDHTGDQRDL